MLPTTKSEKEENYLRYSYLWYGKPKIGKTTTAANFGEDNNKMLFFPTEPGHKFVNIYKWQDDLGNAPTNWLDFKKCCEELTQESHDYACLVVDTFDILWKWCELYICEQHDVQHLSDIKWGKLYALCKDEMMLTINGLAMQGIGFIFMSHEDKQTVEVDEPDPEDPEIMLSKEVEKTDPTLPKGAKVFVKGFCDYIWYFSQNKQGQRFVLTQERNYIQAGSRGDKDCKPLPVTIAMDPDRIKKALERTKEKINE